MSVIDDILTTVSQHPNGLSYQEISNIVKRDYDAVRMAISRDIKKDIESPSFEITKDTPQKVKLTEIGKLKVKKRTEETEEIKKRSETMAKEIKGKQTTAQKEKQLDELLQEKLDAFFQINIKHVYEDAEKHPAYITLDMEKFLQYYTVGFDFALENPAQFIRIAQECLDNVDIPGEDRQKRIQVRLINIPNLEQRRLAEVRSAKCIKKMLSFDGIVMSVSQKYVKFTAITWECKTCGERITLLQEEKYVEPPYACNCGNRRGFDICSRKILNEQTIVLQESEFSSNPVTIKAVLHEDLCDDFRAENRKLIIGQKIRFIGMPQLEEQYHNGRQLTISTPYLDVHSYEAINDVNLELSEEDIAGIKAFSMRPDAIKSLNSMVSPHIFGYETEKEAISLQLFGGVKTGTSRGNIHILLAGDPSTAKTQLLKHTVNNLALKGRFATLSSASHIGLTASVRMDKTISNYVVEAGALVLSDGGLCAIDELDKIKHEDEGHLNHAMESEEFQVDKANIHVSLPASCAILAAANPHTETETFDEYKTDAEQIKFSKTLQSRFDLIFTIKDVENKERDAKIADAVLDGAEIKYPVELDFFRKYLFYARQITPGIPEELRKKLKEQYVSLRGIPRNERITPRDLSALRRLSQASARRRLSDMVNDSDIRTAIRVYGASMRAKRKDGKEDVISDVRTKRDKIKSAIAELSGENGADVELVKERFPQSEELIMMMKQEGELFEPRVGYVKVI